MEDLFGDVGVTNSWQRAYCSGMSSIAEIQSAQRACLEGGDLPICVVISELTGPAAEELQALIRMGGRVMLDSGAFTAFTRGGAVDFDTVVNEYARYAAVAKEAGQLMAVMPDVIGDQLATLELIRRYTIHIGSLIRAGVDVVIPFQRGARSVREFVDVVREVLGTADFRVGLPANKMPIRRAELDDVVHDRFHMLGRVKMTALLSSVLGDLRRRIPSLDVTADAAMLRPHYGTMARKREAALDVLESDWLAMNGANRSPDLTELCGDLVWSGSIGLPDDVWREVAGKICGDANSLIDADAVGELRGVLEDWQLDLLIKVLPGCMASTNAAGAARETRIRLNLAHL